MDTIPLPACVQRKPPAKTAFSGTTPGPGGGGTYVSIPFLPQPVSAIDGKGGYWCSPNDEYVVVHRSLAKGDTLHAIRVAYNRLRVSREEREKEIEAAKKSLARRQVIDADYSLIPDAHPVFVRFDADDRGQLWARRTTTAGAPSAFDVYDGSGRHVALVSTTLAFGRYTPLHMRGDYLYGVVRDADDIPYVVRARIVRGSTGGT